MQILAYRSIRLTNTATCSEKKSGTLPRRDAIHHSRFDYHMRWKQPVVVVGGGTGVKELSGPSSGARCARRGIQRFSGRDFHVLPGGAEAMVAPSPANARGRTQRLPVAGVIQGVAECGGV